MLDLGNMRIGKRMAVGLGILVAFILGMAAFGWWGMSMEKAAGASVTGETQHMLQAEQMKSDIQAISLNIWNLIGEKDNSGKQDDEAAVQNIRSEYKKILEELKAGAKTEEGKQLLKDIEDAMLNMKETNSKLIALGMAGNTEEAISLYSAEATKKLEGVNKSVAAFLEYRQKQLEAQTASAASEEARIKWIIGISIAIALALAVFLGMALTRSLTKPIAVAVAFAEKISNGDLHSDVNEAFLSRTDEVGDLGKAMNAMTHNLRKVVGNVTDGIQTLASSSTELSAVAGQVEGNVRHMSDKTTTVAAAAEESSANTISVASSMEEASSSLSSVASATEEMSATVGEIASNSEKARSISEQAMSQAQAISSMMQQLGVAAHEIGKVTETITDISSQTNLLALNATIEAARAGAAGKGFAVVANEIKELARQTAAATEDIKAKISGVQNSTGSAISDIEKIVGVIQEVSTIVSSIAAAIEEQATVTRDVAGNIAQASAGVKDANERISQTASVSKTIAEDIAGVSSAVSEISAGGEQVQASAGELSKLSEQLKAMIGQFKV